MGVYLAKPATEKFSAQAASDTLEYGASSMQGWRTAQEDAHCCHLDVDCGDTSIFGVFDGHGGADISRFCADRLLNILTDLESYKNGNVEKALEEAFLLLDKTLLEDSVRQQLMEVRLKADQGKNGGLRDDDNDEAESSETSDVSGDDPDQLKAEAQMSMADLIARIVKPKKGSPFIYKKTEKSVGASKLVENGGASSTTSTDSPVATISSSASGRKRAWCPPKDVKKQPEEAAGSSSADSNEKQPSDAAGVSDSDSNNVTKDDITPARKCEPSSGLGSPPSEPQEKRLLISSEHNSDENVVVTNGENGSTCKGSHPDDKCLDGPLADCKQKLNNASKSKDQVEKEVEPSEEKAVEGANGDKSGEDLGQAEEAAEEEEEEAEEAASDEEESGGSSSSQEAEGEEAEEESEEESSDDSDQIYKEMMEDELRHEDSSDDSNEDEDFESRKIRLKKMKALGLLGGAALRRSIMAQSGFVDEDDDSDENGAEEEEEEGNPNSIGPLKVRGGPDIEFLSPPDERVPGVGSGATAIVSLVRGNKLYVANAGDSRCIVYKQGKTIPMSFDHKPDDQIELDRITKAGGRVTPDGRVMGGLNLSRAIGDHLYKRCRDLSLEEQMVSSKPDIKSIDLEGAEFMVLACDGIWNSMTNDEVGEFVHKRLGQMSLTQICSEMFDHCLAPSTAGDGTGCDNMTAIVIKFLKQEPGCGETKPKIEETGSASRQATEQKA